MLRRSDVIHPLLAPKPSFAVETLLATSLCPPVRTMARETLQATSLRMVGRRNRGSLYTRSSNLRNSFVAIQSPHNQISLGQSVVILDFGAQYTQLIARRIREQNVFSVVLPCTASLKEIKSYAPGGIILSGGPSSVYEANAPTMDDQVLHLGLPVLGICYGLHLMTHKLGGKVSPGDKREYGHADVELLRDDCA